MAAIAWELITAAVRMAAGLAAVLLIAGPAQALDPTRHIAQYHHTAWDSRAGIPHGITAIAQTPDGWLWLAAASGLYRFDGVQAELFGAAKLRRTAPISLVTSPDGALWVGEVGGLARIRGERIDVFNFPPEYRGAPALYVAAGRDGLVWVGTHNDVLRFDGRDWRHIAGAWPPGATYADPGGVWALAVGRDGTVWTKNVLGTYYLRRGEARFEAVPDYHGSGVAFAAAPDGHLWTSDSGDARLYALPELTPGAPLPPRRFGAELPPSLVGSVITIDRDNTLWAANRVIGGLRRLTSLTRPVEPESFTTQQGLTAKLCFNVFEDREGDIWVGTQRGLDRFRLADIATEHEIPIRDQAAVLAVTGDAVYVYTGMPAPIPDPTSGGGKLYRVRPGHPPEWLADVGTVFDMKATPSGDLLLSISGRLKRWHDGALTSEALPSEIDGGHVRDLAIAGDDLWISVYEKGLWRRHAGQWSHFVVAPFPASKAPTIMVDASGASWLIYPDAYVQVFGDRTRVFAGAAHPDIGPENGFLPDPDGPIMIGSYGLARFDGQGFHVIDRSRAPLLAGAPYIAETATDMWFVGPDGLAHVSRRAVLHAFDDPAERLDAQIFDTQDGYGRPPSQASDIAAVQGPDGRIWFLTEDGLSWIDPSHLHRNPHPPPVIIRSLTADNSSHPAPANQTLPAGTTKVQIDYTANSLAMPERVQFRYRLAGIDRDWVDAGGRRQAFYTNLGPGDYRFQVIAANNDHVWNDNGAVLAFRIPPTFSQTWVFKALLGLCALAALWFLYQLRMQQVANRLRLQIEQRLDERQRIARELHDTFLQSVQGLILVIHSLAEKMPAAKAERRLMERALELADEVLADGRDRVQNLRWTQDHGDLQTLIAAAVERHGCGATFETTVRVEGAPRRVHPLVVEEIAGVVNEALFNAHKHSQARHVTVELHYDRRRLLVRVRDDGMGFNAEGGVRKGHFGLTGMQERANRIKAHLTILTSPGAGVDAVLSVPARIGYAGAGGCWGLFRRWRLE